MIYKFKTRADGDLIMTGPVGDQLLRLIGKEPAATGIIEAAGLPAAIAALEQAVADGGEASNATEADPNARKPAERVSLKQRAWPMIQMMRRAQAEQADIVWGV